MILQSILDWSEVWGPLVPLISLCFLGKQPRSFIPVIVYLWFALVIDAAIDAGWKFSTCVHDLDKFAAVNQSKCVPDWMFPNNYLYNIHSIGRFIAFGAFFYLSEPIFRRRLDKLLLLVAALLIVINFWFLEKFYDPILISSRLFAFEAGLLLFYCLRFYLFKTKTEAVAYNKGKSYAVVTGLSIYVIFNFFYFLFYGTLVANGYQNFVAYMWNFHNVTYIILCIFIARAFYVSDHK